MTRTSAPARGFVPLLLSLSAGTVAYNTVKNAAVVLVMFSSGHCFAFFPVVAGFLFIAPYLFLSSIAGTLGDKIPRQRVLLGSKVFELASMLVAGAGFLLHQPYVLLAAVLCFGIQATMQGPIKFSILPDLLPADRLARGNSITEALTFVSVLAGTVIGGSILSIDATGIAVSALAVALALLGLAGALLVPALPAPAPDARIRLNVFADTLRLLRLAHGNPAAWSDMLGLSWFWMLGMVMVASFPMLVHGVMHDSPRMLTELLTVFSVAVGLGSLLAGTVFGKQPDTRHAPAILALLGAVTWVFAALTDCAHDAHGNLHLFIVLAVLGVLAGLYSLPLYAAIQREAPADALSRFVAANNVLNAVFMVAGAGIMAALRGFALTDQAILATFGAATVLAGTIQLLIHHKRSPALTDAAAGAAS